VLFPQTIDLLKTRSAPLEIELIYGDYNSFEFDDSFFGGIVQYPTEKGNIHDYSGMVERAHQAGALVIVAADILSLALLKAPAEWNADVVVGSSQRFGVPMGFGGPHAGFLAAKEDHKRFMPGRIIGVSVDVKGNRALRMALQTREQHIKRERATSNICTAQALLASMAGMYAVYHGPEGIREIAEHINVLAGVLASEIKKYGYKNQNEHFFDTLDIEIPTSASVKKIEVLALKAGMNFRYIDDKHIGISFDETTEPEDVKGILQVLSKANNIPFSDNTIKVEAYDNFRAIPDNLSRTSSYLTHPVFNSYYSETEMMRYLKKLENKDLALNRTMIPLGSCTMKLNAAAEMFYLSCPEFAEMHPFVPEDQAEGYHYLINEMTRIFCEITGFKAISFQPNSGAAGEYTGLLVIRAYHKNRGEGHRNVCLIPSSAHGTNPASAHMAGMEIVVVKCDDRGNIDTQDLKEKAILHKDDLSALMVTYPSTHGVFEEDILDIIGIVHENGGQVYMDGANMNAQVGLTNPALIGADVCHLNLHKTFAIPHGGGGPGVGPIAVADHLADFLPSHPIIPTGGKKAISAVASAPYGSASILPISYGYVKLLGADGLVEATKYAILNANYLLACLKDHYNILYTGKNGTCAHEMILDCNEFSRLAGVDVSSIAKRLMDYGFHAPTVAFPVHGTLMVEPTESEPLYELDRFVTAMISIRREIQEIIDGKTDRENNVLKNAPHTQEMVMSDQWNYPYTRQKAAFPVQTDAKFWPPVTRIDDAFGDRNLMCTCPPVERYQ
jgi:glycine dehydrogenase